MICPRCGYEMKEEHLYCERCGAEIQIVPDFEPEIQNSIEETLSTVAWEINPDPSEIPKDFQKKPQEEDFLKEGSVFRGITSRKRILITTLTSVLMALVIILLAGLVYQNYSVNYQIREAEERMEKAQYENALTCLVKAEKLQPEDTGIPYSAIMNWGKQTGRQKSSKMLSLNGRWTRNGRYSILILLLRFLPDSRIMRGLMNC